ncbi:hypothetical protein E2C01_075582 [Portunus trituberculatus]|uniref:Uncharacterized protein n=1 Tax=Portunus trituberculatus TaxID=210409 RepID=A0A5B7IB21_PORTR|nr:hypothetical protein [Portunus trituberculatus]
MALIPWSCRAQGKHPSLCLKVSLPGCIPGQAGEMDEASGARGSSQGERDGPWRRMGVPERDLSCAWRGVSWGLRVQEWQ